MAPNTKNPAQTGEPRKREPDWARGLRDLYDDVVDEPLPPNFKDLLDKLDKQRK